MVEQVKNIKVLRMKFSIVENVRMLRAIIFKLPRPSELPSGAQIPKSKILGIVINIFINFPISLSWRYCLLARSVALPKAVSPHFGHPYGSFAHDRSDRPQKSYEFIEIL